MTHRINIKNRFRKHSPMPVVNPAYVKKTTVHVTKQEQSLDDLEKEYQKFIEEQKKLVAERKKKVKTVDTDRKVEQNKA